MSASQIQSQEFTCGIIDNLLTVASDFRLVQILDELEGKISSTRLRDEIKKSLQISSESLDLAKLYLKILERDTNLASDIIWNYRMKIYKIRDKISVAKRVLDEENQIKMKCIHAFMLDNIPALLQAIYGNINSIPIVKELERNYIITPETAMENIKDHLEVCELILRMIEFHLKRLEQDGFNMITYRRELILIQSVLTSIMQIEGINR